MWDVSSPPTWSNSARRFPDSVSEAVPPFRRARAGNRAEVNINQEDKAPRDRFLLLPYVRESSDGTNPYVATQVDLENAFAKPMRAWSGYTILFPKSNPRVGPPKPFARSPFEGVPPHYVFARGGHGLVIRALEACGAERASLRRFRIVDGFGEMATPSPPRPSRQVWEEPECPFQKERRERRMECNQRWPVTRRCLPQRFVALGAAGFSMSFSSRVKWAAPRPNPGRMSRILHDGEPGLRARV